MTLALLSYYVLLLRRSTSSCAWIWGIRPDTKCDHLRCCVCGPFLNVVHLVLYFNSSCSHAPFRRGAMSKPQNNKRAPVGYSVGFISLRLTEWHLSHASIELFRNVGRVPTKGIQRAPFHQCPVVQRVCNCNNVITSSIQAPMAMSTRIDVRRKVLKISQPFTTCCVSISRTGLSQQLHQCWVTRAVGSADASGSQRSHSPCSAPLCSKIHTVTHC